MVMCILKMLYMAKIAKKALILKRIICRQKADLRVSASSVELRIELRCLI
jgi:hypothetical protein